MENKRLGEELSNCFEVLRRETYKMSNDGREAYDRIVNIVYNLYYDNSKLNEILCDLLKEKNKESEEIENESI